MLERTFPRLHAGEYDVTSPATADYNCIAWAAGDTLLWWWPDTHETAFWPPGVAREEHIGAFVEAYATLGYERCENPGLEPGFEKVAIFADTEGRPKHAARQLDDGTWSSKLGKSVDIRHPDVGDVGGTVYGEPLVFLRRPRGRESQ